MRKKQPTNERNKGRDTRAYDQIKVDGERPILEPELIDDTEYDMEPPRTEYMEYNRRPEAPGKRQVSPQKKNKKTMIIVVAIIIAICVIASVVMIVMSMTSAKVTNITGIEDNISLNVGESKQLYPVIEPKEYVDEKIKYTVDDDAIAQVSDDGNLLGKSSGETQLKVKAGGYEKVVTVTVEGGIEDQEETTSATQAQTTQKATENTTQPTTQKQTQKPTQASTTKKPPTPPTVQSTTSVPDEGDL
ncbi:MAG: Ig-like domain-containing protein [Anaerovoracaceae bacterium]